MYKTIKPLATGLVKKQIEKAVRDALITGLEYIDGQLVAVRDRMETVKQTEGHTRTDVLKEVCFTDFGIFGLPILPCPVIPKQEKRSQIERGERKVVTIQDCGQ